MSVSNVRLADAVHSLETRRADVEAKQEWVGELIREFTAEGLLILDPANFRWLTCGAMPRGLRTVAEEPALFLSTEQRWLLCPNMDSQRLFDEEVDQLGFQLKEWPWTTGKRRLLDDLIAQRKLICDQPFTQLEMVGDRLRRARLELTTYERERFRDLGRMVAHAVEATARNFERGDTEEEIAGQLGHRLLHHGVHPVNVEVTGDERFGLYRRGGYRVESARDRCFISAVGEREGLYVTAGRSVVFDEPEESLRWDFDRALRLGAAYRAGSKPKIPVTALFESCAELLPEGAVEVSWRGGPPACFTGRAPAEAIVGARQGESFHLHQAIVWQVTIGAARVVDTVLVDEHGAVSVTPTEDWPVRRTKLDGHDIALPDLLVRRD